MSFPGLEVIQKFCFLLLYLDQLLHDRQEHIYRRERASICSNQSNSHVLHHFYIYTTDAMPCHAMPTLLYTTSILHLLYMYVPTHTGENQSTNQPQQAGPASPPYVCMYVKNEIQALSVAWPPFFFFFGSRDYLLLFVCLSVCLIQQPTKASKQPFFLPKQKHEKIMCAFKNRFFSSFPRRTTFLFFSFYSFLR